MKKTFIALLALSGVVMGSTKTEWTMSELAQAATNNNKATISEEWVYEGGDVYSFSNQSYLGGISDADLNALFTGTSGTCITIAAWVRVNSLSGYQAIFGYGAQNDGCVFTLNGSNLLYTSKGVDERGSAPSRLAAGEWGLVALTFVQGSKESTNDQEQTVYTTADGRFQDAVGGYYTRKVGSFKTPATADQLFSIGSGNGTSARDSFTGEIAGLTIFSGTTTQVVPSTIIGKLGSAPVQVPEPATATLSLLALAGLVARRRRH